MCIVQLANIIKIHFHFKINLIALRNAAVHGKVPTSGSDEGGSPGGGRTAKLGAFGPFWYEIVKIGQNPSWEPPGRFGTQSVL